MVTTNCNLLRPLIIVLLIAINSFAQQRIPIPTITPASYLPATKPGPTMSNGLFLAGLRGCQIRNNYVFRTGQDAVQAYGINGCVIEDNDFEATGGGGNPTLLFISSRNTVTLAEINLEIVRGWASTPTQDLSIDVVRTMFSKIIL